MSSLTVPYGPSPIIPDANLTSLIVLRGLVYRHIFNLPLYQVEGEDKHYLEPASGICICRYDTSIPLGPFQLQVVLFVFFLPSFPFISIHDLLRNFYSNCNCISLMFDQICCRFRQHFETIKWNALRKERTKHTVSYGHWNVFQKTVV